MKKQNDIHTTIRTNIKDISPVGSELSDEQLRLVAGGKIKTTDKGKTKGKTGCIRPDFSHD